MTELLIPFAVDETGQVFSPLTAPRNKTYLCPDCQNPVGVRRRDRANREEESPFTPHFYHLTEVPCTGTGESYTHKAAKGVLLFRLQQELTTLGGFHLAEKCPGHQGSCSQHSLIPTLFPLSEEEWDGLQLEVEYTTAEAKFRFDVALLKEKQVVVGFEVFHRHKVPQEKANALDVPWFEFVAEDILEGKPLLPYEPDFSRDLCPTCLEKMALLEIKRENERRKQDITEQRQQQKDKYLPEHHRIKGRWERLSSREHVEALRKQLKPPPKQEARPAPAPSSNSPKAGQTAREFFQGGPSVNPPANLPAPRPAAAFPPPPPLPARTMPLRWLEFSRTQGMEGFWDTRFYGMVVWVNLHLLSEGLVMSSISPTGNRQTVVAQGAFMRSAPGLFASGSKVPPNEVMLLLENVNRLGRQPDGMKVTGQTTLKLGEVGWVMFEVLKVLADSLPS